VSAKSRSLELILFGTPSILCPDTGHEANMRPQLWAALAAIVLEGDSNLAVADERLIACLWEKAETETGVPARLDRLIHELRTVLNDLNGGDHLDRHAGKVQLYDVSVDCRGFDIAYNRKEYDAALKLAADGALLDGLRSPSRRNGYDWVERARSRYGTRVDRCYREVAEATAVLVRRGKVDIAELIDLVEARARSAVAYDLPDEVKQARLELERLHALEDSGALASAPAQQPAGSSGHVPGKLPLDRLIVSRLGSGLSLHVDPEHVDHVHRYIYVSRTDLLDYPSGDFYSLRRLRGRNESDKPSPGIIYTESSEAKITFESTGTRAYETQSRRRLAVEPLLPSDIELFQHGFRILFQSPLPPGEEFDIAFAIRLPGELRFLSPNEEIMSIALVRWELGVERLDFRVCLNFEPLSVAGEYVDEAGEFAPLDDPPALAPYVAEEWYERDLDIPWSSTPFAVSCQIDKPRAPMYVIRYRV
jgi:DNA-binding SARP family transcriptional activator